LKENYIKFIIMKNNMFERITIIMRKKAGHRNSLVYNRVFKVYKHINLKKRFFYILYNYINSYIQIWVLKVILMHNVYYTLYRV